jgi:hypothetical protein
MYGSYYLITLDRNIGIAVGEPPMVFYKVEARQFMDVEDLAHTIAGYLNETMDSDWTLRSIDKKYMYSGDEYEHMDGKFDFRLTFGIQPSDDTLAKVASKPFIEAMEKAGLL